MPLESSGRGTFFLWPPRAPLKPLLETQRLPQSTQGTHMSSQGLHQTRKVGILETLEISLFGSQDLKKLSPATFLHSESCPETLQSGRPCFVGRLGAPKTLPSVPNDPLGPPCKFQSVHLGNKNRRLCGFTHISNVFDEFARATAPLQICPGQLLHIFPTDIENSIHRWHLRESPLGPSG